MRLLLLIAWVCFALPALAQERFALVIGNAEYPAGVGRLEHTHEDADRIADALEEVGFHVTLLKDQDRTGMQAAVLKYQGELLDHPGAIGFFYYSGHGVAAAVPGNGRRNFLVPARAPVTRAEQLPLLGYRLDEIIAALSATRAKALFVVSDACRSTLPVSGSKGSGGEEDKGLVPESSVPGMLIAFATAENASAPDDGVFSSALSKEIVQTGQDASLAFLRALQDVATRRDAGRMPFFTPGLIPRDVCFASCDKGIDPGDAATWAEIRTDCEAELYLAAYPKGAYAAAAGVRRKRCQSASQGTPQTSQTAAQRLADELAGIDYASPGFRTWITLRDVAERYGFETLEQLGEEKDPNALGLLGTAYDQGIFVEQDKTRGADLFRSACELGQMVACNNYGAAFENGKGVPVDLAAAVNLFRQSCDGGEMTGCRNLGFMYEKGRGVTQDASEAVRLYRQACDGGEMRGCGNLGVMYEKGRGVTPDAPEAVRLYRQACDGGGMTGCRNLGVMYSKGRGVTQDAAEAVRLYRQACDGGEMTGCRNLGFMYEKGRGVTQDASEAVRLYRQACDGGEMRGCGNLGFMYGEGRGVTQDASEAVRLYRQACDGGEMSGCNNLGFMNEKGRGVAQNLSEAVRLYRQACDGGGMIGCKNLGVMYSEGLGVEQDVDEAGRLYGQACDGGDTAACKLLND